MKAIRIKYLCVLAFIVFPLIILGCSPAKKEEKTANITEEIKLNSGAILKSEDGEYKVYNYENGEYNSIKTDKDILSYDKSSSNYIYRQDEKDYYENNEKTYQVKDEEHTQIKLSPGGNYISYFIEDNGLKLKIFKTTDNSKLEFNSQVSISGVLYDWYDSDTIVYYGVSDDGVNGLFTYNIKDGKEELLYKIKEGYLAYLKGSNDNVVFLQLTLENNKQLMIIDKKTKESKMLTNQIEELSDIVVHKNKIYFTGKVLDNASSLYELKDNVPKRLVFDFPSNIKAEKGMEIDENGNILIIGSNAKDSNLEQIYSYADDGSISLVSKDSADCAFIGYRN